MARKRSVKFPIVARFTGGGPSDGWLVVEPHGVVTVRRKGRRTTYTCTLDGLAQLVIWRDAQAKAMERAREAKARKQQQREARAARRLFTGRKGVK